MFGASPPVAATPMRALRAGVFATVMALLAVLAHAAAGAMLPSAGVVVAAGLFLTLVVYPLTTRERGLPVVLAATAAAQVGLHVVFTLAMAPTCRPGPAGASGSVMAGMGTPGISVGGGCGSSSWTEMGSRGGVSMTATHVVAGLVSAWWLRRGERAVTRLLRLLYPALRRWSFGTTLPTAGLFKARVARWTVTGEAGGTLPLGRPHLRRVLSRRGPPAVITT